MEILEKAVYKIFFMQMREAGQTFERNDKNGIIQIFEQGNKLGRF